MLDTASDVELYTGRPLAMILDQSSARTGPAPSAKNYACFSMSYNNAKPITELRREPLFPLRRQDLPSTWCKTGPPDCLPGIRPILKSGFQPFRHGEIDLGIVARRSNCKPF